VSPLVGGATRLSEKHWATEPTFSTFAYKPWIVEIERFALRRVFYRNLALLYLRVLLLPFIILLQNKHTTLA